MTLRLFITNSTNPYYKVGHYKVISGGTWVAPINMAENTWVWIAGVSYFTLLIGVYIWPHLELDSMANFVESIELVRFQKSKIHPEWFHQNGLIKGQKKGPTFYQHGSFSTIFPRIPNSILSRGSGDSPTLPWLFGSPIFPKRNPQGFPRVPPPPLGHPPNPEKEKTFRNFQSLIIDWSIWDPYNGLL